MQNKTIITLLILPLLIAGILYFLNSAVYSLGMVRGNMIGVGLGGGGSEDLPWNWLIPGGIILCGFFLIFVMIPLLFRNSLINWKNNDSSWKWQLGVILPALLIGGVMEFPGGYLALATIPLSLIVFGISLLVTLIMAARVNAKSTFFRILLGFTVITGGIIAFVFYSLSNLSLCYCPVNHKSFTKDFLLKPLYDYRRKQLKNRLNI